MKVVGISGLENSVPFKRAQWPNLDQREYRIAPGLDAAAALVVDGRIVAAAGQERFSGKKRAGNFPIDAIQYCLAQAGVSIHEIDEIAHSFDYTPYRELYAGDAISADFYRKVLSRDALLGQVRRELPAFPLENVHQVGHHLAHAASAAYTSGWDECLVVVNDTMGEVESISIYHFREGALHQIGAVGAGDSIGVFYSLVALHLGFDFGCDDYNVMGVAPYGDPGRYRQFFEQAVVLCPDGSIRIPMLKLNQTREEREHYMATRSYLDQHLGPRRLPDQPIDSFHEDAAAALQECLERVVMHICAHFGRKTGLRRLALAGGVSLNCAANDKLRRSGLFDEVYAQPVAGDDGAALGAALYRTALTITVTNRRLGAPLLGPRYSNGEIESALYRCNGRIKWSRLSSLDEVCDVAAKLIAQGNIIAWSRGRMEFGPHALGNRSILADPANPEMRERINLIKKRESSRPFAAACALEEAHHWFDIDPGAEFPCMTSIVSVRPEVRDQIPAVAHVNGSARLQTVSVKENPDFHKLLAAVGRATGRPMVLNTSLNLQGQPTVNTPEDAIVTFLGTGIGHLFLENFHVTRGAI